MTLNEEMNEPDRRALVQRIAERGSRSQETADTATQPSQDYSAAAEAAFEGDPEYVRRCGDNTGSRKLYELRRAFLSAYA